MKPAFKISLFVLCLVPLGGLLCGCAGPERRSVRAADGILGAATPPDAARIAAAAAMFRESDLSAGRLKRYSDSSLGKVYDGLYGAAYTFPEDIVYLRLQRAVLDEKLRRTRQAASEVQRMHRNYVAARMFGEAAALAGCFPELSFQAVPETVADETAGKTKWRVFDIPESGSSVTLKALGLGSGRKVVMTMFPGCAVAEKAMTSIMAAPGLSVPFREYGMLLTARFSLENARLWKTSFNFPGFYLAYKASDFPGMDYRTSPNFYFLRDGEVKFHFFGWDKREGPSSGAAQMAKGLLAIGAAPEGGAR